MLLTQERALDHWASSPQGLLALILLTDQFPRNVYRNSGKAFSFDPLARAWCEATVQRFPEYLDSADAPEALAASEANVRFGRRFEVISFRWLSPDEI